MRTIKIDIKQEVIDMEPRPYYLFHKLDEDMPSMMVKADDMLSATVNLHTETYYTTEFYNPNAKEKRIFYLIKRDDRGLVNDLVKIEQDILASKIYKKSMIAYNDGWERSKNYVKKCSWWKRLTNTF